MLRQLHKLYAQHRAKFAMFSSIGACVFALGAAVLYLFVDVFHMSTGWAFLLQGVVSIETSYFLNWKLTWKDRNAKFWRGFWRFHVTRIATVPPNQGLYMLLVYLGMEYQVANFVETLIFVVGNYAITHAWVFIHPNTAE